MLNKWLHPPHRIIGNPELHPSERKILPPLISDDARCRCSTCWNRGSRWRILKMPSQGSRLTIDGQIEHRQVSDPSLDLQLRPDHPDMFWPERRLCADQLAFFPRGAFDRVSVFVILHGQIPQLLEDDHHADRSRALKSCQLSSNWRHRAPNDADHVGDV